MRSRRHPGLYWLVLIVLTSSGCSALFGGSSGSDPDRPSCDPTSCDTLGGSCTAAGQCKFSCEGMTCGCPAGMDCAITVPDSYTGEVDCSAADNCDVLCGLEGSCANNVVTCGVDCAVDCVGQYKCTSSLALMCGIGECSFTCLEKGSCSGVSIACGTATLCELRCADSACQGLSFDCEEANECGASCLDQDSCSGADLICAEPALCNFDCGNADPAICQ